MAILEKVFEYLLIHYRWVFVVFFLLPLSALYDAFYYLRWFKLLSSPKHHDKRVKHVQKQIGMSGFESDHSTPEEEHNRLSSSQDDGTSPLSTPTTSKVKLTAFLHNYFKIVGNTAVCKKCGATCKTPQGVNSNLHRHLKVAAWNASGQETAMCTSRPGWQTMSFRQAKYKSSLHCIDIKLMDILQVDTKQRVVRVEPLVTMGQITAVLNPLGWTLPIVPELDDLTVGGMVNGTGVETSSHKYGLFQHICHAYELVLSDGSLVRCSKEENSDLFYSIPWSHGTLGFLVAAELLIVPAKKYVRVDYIPAQSMDQMDEIVNREISNPENDFVEGLAFSKDTAVIMAARMTDQCDQDKVNEIGRFHKPWFFTHAQKYLNQGRGIEYIPLRDYYHRHSRSLFWEIQDIIPFGNNVLFRRLFGWLVPPKVSLLKLTQTATTKKFYERYQFIQDIIVPIGNLRQSVDFLDKNINVYPLWICPVQLFPDPGMVHSRTDKLDMFVDVGIYGSPKVKNYDAEKSTREVEAFVRSLRGYQMLYADTYQTREEFRDMFDHSQYDAVRQRLNCAKAFPEVYDKIKKSARF